MLTLQTYPQISRSLADQELLDRPYINKHTGLDFLVMCFMGSVLGLLSIPYCAWNRMVWSDGMVHLVGSFRMSLRNMLKPVETPWPGSLFTKFHKASAFSVDFLLFGSSFCMFLSRAFPQAASHQKRCRTWRYVGSAYSSFS